jgi:hypothetical protein
MNRADADRRLSRLEEMAKRLVQEIADLRNDLCQPPPPTPTPTTDKSQTSQTRPSSTPNTRAPRLPGARPARRPQAAWRPPQRRSAVQQRVEASGLCRACKEPVQACDCGSLGGRA